MKKKTIRRVLMVALGLVFLGSAGMAIYNQIQYKEGDEVYAEAEELVELPDLSQIQEPVEQETKEEPEEPAQEEETLEEAPEEEKPVYVDPYADALRNMDFAALQEVNSEVLGWILIPFTQVSYPFVQGTDNDYYLKHTWKKSYSVVGSIFMECENNSDLNDFNTIIYGHRMNNGSMFASLKNYSKQSYWEEHPRIYIINDAGMYTYEIFSAYEVGTAEDTYRLSFADETVKQEFLDFCVGQSVIGTGIIPTVEDHILTLSTCTGRGHTTRWVVQAVEVERPASQ